MLLNQFYNDETGFVLSAELILVATVLVIGMIVGLSEVQHSVTAELNDVADAVGSVNQSYYYSGFAAYKNFGGFMNTGMVKSTTTGSAFIDFGDDCDYNQCTLSCQGATMERPKGVDCEQNTCAASCSNIR